MLVQGGGVQRRIQNRVSFADFGNMPASNDQARVHVGRLSWIGRTRTRAGTNV
jgi:hypothetical protein